MSGRGKHKALLSGTGGRLLAAAGIGVWCLAAAVFLGYRIHRLGEGISLAGTSLILEAQPGAVAAVALGFPPRTGAAIAMLSNMAPLPLLSAGVAELLTRWPWAQRKLSRTQRWASRYRRWGALIFVPLSPFIGAYTAMAVGNSLKFRPVLTFWAVLTGMIWSVLVITYGGHWVVHLFGHY